MIGMADTPKRKPGRPKLPKGQRRETRGVTVPGALLAVWRRAARAGHSETIRAHLETSLRLVLVRLGYQVPLVILRGDPAGGAGTDCEGDT